MLIHKIGGLMAIQIMKVIDNLLSALDLNQIICEPTNFEEKKNPSCIDLIFCDQSNIIVDSGVRSSLDPFCKHQITYCNINFNMPSAPSYMRNVWHYRRANTQLIRRTVSEFPWHDHLNNHDPNWQVDFFNNTILNVMSNFIPNDYIKIQPIKIKIKFSDCSRGRPEGSLFFSFYQLVGEGATPFPCVSTI